MGDDLDKQASSSQSGHPPAATNDAVGEAGATVQKLEVEKASLTSTIDAITAALRTELLKTKTADEVHNAVTYDMVLDNEGQVARAMRAKLAELKARLEKAVSVHEKAVSTYADLVAMQKAAQVPQVCYVCVCVCVCVCGGGGDMISNAGENTREPETDEGDGCKVGQGVVDEQVRVSVRGVEGLRRRLAVFQVLHRRKA